MFTLNNLNPFASSNLPPPSKIISLRVYPIKSCRGFEVTHTTLRKRGLDLDRQWMFVDATTRKFLTIRDISKMTLVRTSLSADGSQLQIRVDDTDKSIEIPARPSQEWLQENTKLVPAKVWSADTDGYEYSNDVNGIFSDFFGRKVALILKGPTPRILSGNGAPECLGRTESTQFADGEYIFHSLLHTAFKPSQRALWPPANPSILIHPSPPNPNRFPSLHRRTQHPPKSTRPQPNLNRTLPPQHHHRRHHSLVRRHLVPRPHQRHPILPFLLPPLPQLLSPRPRRRLPLRALPSPQRRPRHGGEEQARAVGHADVVSKG